MVTLLRNNEKSALLYFATRLLMEIIFYIKGPHFEKILAASLKFMYIFKIIFKKIQICHLVYKDVKGYGEAVCNS
jgi:hypothetical protein